MATNGGIVIVGCGLAAARTAEQLRRAEYTGPITIVSDEQRMRPAGSEVLRLWADNRKAGQLIGWRPQVSLDAGLARTVEWSRGNLSRYRPGVYEV